MQDHRRLNFVLVILLQVWMMTVGTGVCQQVPDTVFRFGNTHPAYRPGSGPVVMIDGAHVNFHTREGGFAPFARLLEQDGYRVVSLDEPLNQAGVLIDCRILVIANALDSSNGERWTLPTPSAFSGKEIGVIRDWVSRGGRLLLIADHMPFAGAAFDLGQAFGFSFLNGFAFTSARSWPPSVFVRNDQTLADSPVTTGAIAGDGIDRVATFTGSAFRPPEGAVSVLRFRPEHWVLMPDTAWRFNAGTPRKSLAGYSQGAILEFGRGKVAVFGEAAMFTAQIVNGTAPVGFNSPEAPQNSRFVLNLLHWLDK